MLDVRIPRPISAILNKIEILFLCFVCFCVCCAFWIKIACFLFIVRFISMVPHRAFCWEQLFLLTLLSLYLTYTVYPGSRDPFYIVTYYKKWVTPSWTYCNMLHIPPLVYLVSNWNLNNIFWCRLFSQV